jgi:hypothetical protein
MALQLTINVAIAFPQKIAGLELALAEDWFAIGRPYPVLFIDWLHCGHDGIEPPFDTITISNFSLPQAFVLCNSQVRAYTFVIKYSCFAVEANHLHQDSPFSHIFSVQKPSHKSPVDVVHFE